MRRYGQQTAFEVLGEISTTEQDYGNATHMLQSARGNAQTGATRCWLRRRLSIELKSNALVLFTPTAEAKDNILKVRLGVVETQRKLEEEMRRKTMEVMDKRD